MVLPLEWQSFIYWRNKLRDRQMILETTTNYTLITSDENTFSDFYANFKKQHADLETAHIIVQLSEKLNTSKEEILLFLGIAAQHKKNSTSFVLIIDTISIEDFPEDFNIVPTLEEAADIVEIEAIERELGF